MCGICGVYNFSNAPVDRNILEKMTRTMIHRGPDGEGFYLKGNIGLGHRRLIIIDPETGSQPMYDDAKNTVIVYNGEIYNYIELRDELKLLGHRFITDSDTEVIIYAYKQWGVDFQNKLNGMWALSIWDNSKKELFLSRDRLGEKPLYYAFSESTFLFASEIKSILAYGYPKEANLELMEVYLSLGYIPAPFTFYKGIYKLMPGHFIIVKGNNVKESQYWDLPRIDEKNMLSNKNEIYEQFEYLLKDSVKLRMRSDVPFGAFLSGGLDSASIVALLSEISSSPVTTFTVGFSEKDYNERLLAREVAGRFKTKHHETTISSGTFEDALTKVVFHYDEAFGDSSAIPMAHISRYASRKVKMVLTGDGGDEALSGYTTYQGEKFAALYQLLPPVLKNAIPKILFHFSRLTREKPRYKINRLIDICKSSNFTFEHRLIEKNSWINLGLIRSLLEKSTSRISIIDFLTDFMARCRYQDNFYKIMYFNLKFSLPDDMLVKVDRMTMAYSLEARIPFLDYRLLEFMVRVDKDIKMQGYERKSVLRRSIGKRLPPKLLHAPKKGFTVPLREWFKEKAFENKLNCLYSLSRYGLNPAVIKQIINSNIKGKRDYGNFIWMLFVLNKWLEN